jgi:hypothetical protein
MSKKAEVILVLDKNDKDQGEKKGSGRYVAASGQDEPALLNAYINRSFVGPQGQTMKKVKVTLEEVE